MTTRAETLLRELRDVYDGTPWYGSPVKTIVDGVDADALAREPRIQKLLAHLTAWMEISARRVSGELFEVTPELDFPPTDGVAWSDQVDRLARAHEGLVQIAGRFTDSDLDAVVPGKKHTFEFELRGVVQHCIYHAAQIALLKKR